MKEKGDEAVFEYTEKFDGVRLDAEHLLVTEEEIAEAYEQVDDELIAIIRKALVNIRDYHRNRCSTAGLTVNRTEQFLDRK